MAGYDVMFRMCGDGGRCAPTMREIISAVPGGVKEVLRDVVEPDMNLRPVLAMGDLASRLFYNCTPPATHQRECLIQAVSSKVSGRLTSSLFASEI